MAKVILVTGATGRQGSAVIRALLGLKLEDLIILAVTRDVSSAAARQLKSISNSIKLVQGNLDDVPLVFKEAQSVAKQPIWGVYSVQVSTGKGVTFEREIEQGKSLIDESIKAGVKHFVYSSVERGGDEASWSNPTPIPHFQTKYEIEHHLRNATATGETGVNMGWTILRPVAVISSLPDHQQLGTRHCLGKVAFANLCQFMENLSPGFSTKVFLAALHNWLEDKPMQWVSIKDIGVFAAKAFAAPRSWNKRAVGIAGDELNFDEMSEWFQLLTGQRAPTTFSFLGGALTLMVTEIRVMISWFSNDGYHADIDARRADHPELLSFGEWLERESQFETLEV
ncbi:hypothetical protein NUW58_g5047 [Xylaria curta]|uniref:Uncharacterized protein n=1 Tax=Xylaria curta TaxID=42375 RepID=A0ACC1P4T6_9PEZI|nr:hypothetical protein NUW58_g5047 [Xylaria curta]